MSGMHCMRCIEGKGVFEGIAANGKFGNQIREAGPGLSREGSKSWPCMRCMRCMHRIHRILGVFPGDRRWG